MIVTSAGAAVTLITSKDAVAVFDVPGDDVDEVEIEPVVLAVVVLPKEIPLPDQEVNLYPAFAVA